MATFTCTNKPGPEVTERRAELHSDIDQYLANGGSIQVVATGHSAHAETGKRQPRGEALRAQKRRDTIAREAAAERRAKG
jgi:hypothetical protein